jgi:hypothetical protein
VNQRRKAFANIKIVEFLASAKVSVFMPINNKSYGFAVFDNQLIMVEGMLDFYSVRSITLIPTFTSVITMYEKSAGKAARHAWTSKSTSIGAISYIAVQCYEHTRQRRFRPMECAATRTARFHHLPAFAFLCLVPQSSVRHTSSGSSDFIELQPGAFCDIFHLLLSERYAVLSAASGLLVPTRKNRLEINEEE